ncbi:MAG: tryptophan--tRNA ligase [Candidatus Liptonbacteria bacterium]|nr:tryptophan--tRNA ligase [Candidatus Liptonbacteria bacterium]
MIKPILISGIQPTGRLHLGNYLGALKNFVALQNSGKYQCFFFIADLHSLTEEYSPKEKTKQINELATDYLAAGLDPKKSTIFLQSKIPAHSELAWILNTITPMGELNRMTQFKDKKMQSALSNVSGKAISVANTETSTEQIVEEEIMKYTNMGLFDYPVLMAADILLYDAKFVPVGDDQLQHLELARTLARKFNSKFGKTFAEPQPLLTELPRVMSLDNPLKKMSKSNPAGCLFLDDSPETIKEKIKRAVTDSDTHIRYDAQAKPAISNLLRIYASLSNSLVPDIEKQFEGKNYSEFKLALADIVAKHLESFFKNKKTMLKKPALIRAVLGAGNKKAGGLATKKILAIKKRIGLPQ